MKQEELDFRMSMIEFTISILEEIVDETPSGKASHTLRDRIHYLKFIIGELKRSKNIHVSLDVSDSVDRLINRCRDAIKREYKPSLFSEILSD